MPSDQIAQLEHLLDALKLATVPDSEDTPTRKKEIAEQITNYCQQIANLRQRLNSQLPIIRLPPEVLTGIFRQYIVLVHRREREEVGTHGKGRPYNWIRVTHVCHSWRVVALSTPKLWSHIVVTRPECIRELLSRSKNAPLSLKANLLKHPSAFSLTRTVLSHLGRIVTIDLQVARAQVLVELCYDTPPARSLSSLTINIVDQSTSADDDSSPLPFVDSQTTTLQHVSYICPVFLWNPSVAQPSLKSLVLVSTRPTALRIPNHSSSTTTVLHALQNLPLLEDLKLERLFPAGAGQQSEHHGAATSLSRLRLFHLTDSAPTCYSLLRGLRIPKSTILRLDITLNNAQDFRRIVEAIGVSQSIPAQSDYPIRSMSAASSSGQDFRLQTWTEVQSLSFLANPSQTPFMDLIVHGLPGLLHPAIQVVTTQLQLDNLRTLSIERDWTSPEDHALWRDGSQEMADLRGLRVCGRIGNRLPEVFALVGNQSAPPFLPRLKALMLENIDMKMETDSTGTFLYSLRDSLLVRSQNGIGLQKLLLKVCVNLLSDEVDDLATVVSEVMWDRTEFLTPKDGHGSGGVTWLEVKEDIRDDVKDYVDSEIPH